MAIWNIVGCVDCLRPLTFPSLIFLPLTPLPFPTFKPSNFQTFKQGVVLRYAIQQRAGPAPDFILCMGDDASDEYMFTAMYAYIADQVRYTGNGLNVGIS